MFEWFKSRVRKGKEWFSIRHPVYNLQGTKGRDGTLELYVTVRGTTLSILLDRENAVRLSEWMSRTYPHEVNNVIPITRGKLSLLSNSSTPEGSSGPIIVTAQQIVQLILLSFALSYIFKVLNYYIPVEPNPPLSVFDRLSTYSISILEVNNHLIFCHIVAF